METNEKQYAAYLAMNSATLAVAAVKLFQAIDSNADNQDKLLADVLGCFSIVETLCHRITSPQREDQ